MYRLSAFPQPGILKKPPDIDGMPTPKKHVRFEKEIEELNGAVDLSLNAGRNATVLSDNGGDAGNGLK